VPFGFTPVAVCNRLGAKAEVKQESKAKDKKRLQKKHCLYSLIYSTPLITREYNFFYPLPFFKNPNTLIPFFKQSIKIGQPNVLFLSRSK
jgi:hypothetical protein